MPHLSKSKSGRKQKRTKLLTTTLHTHKKNKSTCYNLIPIGFSVFNAISDGMLCFVHYVIFFTLQLVGF